MLVLSRSECETIMVGDDIKITIVRVNRGIVRVGVDAPANVPIHREEVYIARQKELAQKMKEQYDGTL